MTPLHVAAERGHPRIVEYLVDKGADIDIQDKNGVNMYDYSNHSYVYQCSLSFELATHNNSLERI